MICRRHLAGAGIVFAMVLLPRVGVGDETLSLPRGNAGLIARGRALLRSGDVAAADRLVRAGLEPGADDAIWCLAGEVRFRRGDFDGARRAFQTATDTNRDNARAWWGIGRIERIHFNPAAARDLFAKAYRLDPHDTDIILSYLDFVTNLRDREILLRNVVFLSRAATLERAERATAQLQIEAYLGGRPAGALASSHTSYRLPLGGFHPTDATPRGLVVTVRVNGGRALRLLLDTGARGILLNKSAARGLGLEPIVESQVGGFGGSSASDSTLSLARSVAFGDLAFHDCLIEVSTRGVTSGADGILGPSLFERFRVRIDARSRTIELTPHEAAGGGGVAEAAQSVRALGLDRLLLMRATVPGGHEGWFLLDTGAAFTGISRSLTSAAQAHSGGLDLAGVQGAVDAFHVAPMGLQVGGRVLAEHEAVALDLGRLSQREGVEISGILGYSTLSRWPVTIDFRSGMVRIGDGR